MVVDMKKISLTLLILCIAACSGPDSDTPAGGAAINTDEGPAAVARDVAAIHAGVQPADVTIIDVVPENFPNAGLGCPDPDMAYAAVITPGHQVEVQVGDETLDVRVAGTSGFVCKIDTKIPDKEVAR